MVLQYCDRIRRICSQKVRGGVAVAKCEVCEKAMRTGHRISITRSQVSRRANRRWKPNVKKIQIIDENNAVRSIHVCTRCMRSNKVTRAI